MQREVRYLNWSVRAVLLGLIGCNSGLLVFRYVTTYLSYERVHAGFLLGLIASFGMCIVAVARTGRAGRTGDTGSSNRFR